MSVLKDFVRDVYRVPEFRIEMFFQEKKGGEHVSFEDWDDFRRWKYECKTLKIPKITMIIFEDRNQTMGKHEDRRNLIRNKRRRYLDSE